MHWVANWAPDSWVPGPSCFATSWFRPHFPFPSSPCKKEGSKWCDQSDNQTWMSPSVNLSGNYQCSDNWQQQPQQFQWSIVFYVWMCESRRGCFAALEFSSSPRSAAGPLMLLLWVLKSLSNIPHSCPNVHFIMYFCFIRFVKFAKQSASNILVNTMWYETFS